jgi:hypothetical protein
MCITITDSVTDSLYDVDHELCYGVCHNYLKPLLFVKQINKSSLEVWPNNTILLTEKLM